MSCYIQYVQIYTIYIVHVNCDKNYGGQTFSYILEIKIIFWKEHYSQQLSWIRKIFMRLVDSNIISEDFSSVTIQKHYTQEYSDTCIRRPFDPYCRHGNVLGCHTIISHTKCSIFNPPTPKKMIHDKIIQLAELGKLATLLYVWIKQLEEEGHSLGDCWGVLMYNILRFLQ